MGECESVLSACLFDSTWNPFTFTPPHPPPLDMYTGVLHVLSQIDRYLSFCLISVAFFLIACFISVYNIKKGFL